MSAKYRCRWSAIQTLLERSKSDVLILLDCCAGAASATFPNGNSITETISASTWDAIAPDPGRYSFTNALIEVLQEWRMRTFSAAMLHAEVLARLKHPRPININGKHFEARSTPVHFMMTANHKAPSIELSRVLPQEKVPESGLGPATSHHDDAVPLIRGRVAADSGDSISQGLASNEPNENTPHVMISLALEDDQQLDINAWEQWLNAFPSMAKYVQVQGVFKSHSTLMLVSLPVMVWDLLPEDPAISFVAFIRSNNLAMQRRQMAQRIAVPVSSRQQQRDIDSFDNQSIATGVSETTFVATENLPFQQQYVGSSPSYGDTSNSNAANASSSRVTSSSRPLTPGRPVSPSASLPGSFARPVQSVAPTTSLNTFQRQAAAPVPGSSALIPSQMILNQQQSMKRATHAGYLPRKFAAHVERRLEEYYQDTPAPSRAHSAFIASNLGIELYHLEAWFRHRRENDSISNRLATIKLKDYVFGVNSQDARMILPAELNRLLELSLPGDALLFDLRSPSEYKRSHVYGAIDLRAPKTFLEAAPLYLIARAIPDEQGRNRFNQWISAKCLVFYGRSLEFSWECPAAELITQKLRKVGWRGHCFILRGHYREFSQSFDKHIVGAKMTQLAKDWISSQATAFTSEVDRIKVEDKYTSWLFGIEAQGQARPSSTSPSHALERREAFETQEKNLDAEFKARCGPLFGDAMAAKYEMVEYLDRGLEDMRGLTQLSSIPIYHGPMEPMELTSEDMPFNYLSKSLQEQDVEDEYVEISKPGKPSLSPSFNQVGQQNHI